ncbi:MAG: DNA-formamidopyrimidine glycosylase family protein [Bacteroidota bacterium]
MPELPEVHTFHRYFDAAALQQKVLQVDVSDDKIIRNMSGTDFAQRMAGRTFTSSLRRGKYLFADLDNGHSVLLHFGMTGDLKLYQEAEEAPRFERFAFVLADGNRLGFDDARKFARVLYLEDRDAYIEEVKLGIDALDITEEQFLTAMGQRKVSIKGFLLDQKSLAGMGNLYADEVCYRTQVDPASPAAAIPIRKRQEIFAKMKEVLTTAVEQSPYYKDYPDNWFWNEWRHEDHLAPDGKSKVQMGKVAGRTTYWAAPWQRLYKK